MQRHPTDPPDEEIFEATKERSHRTVAGIEVVEYEQSGNEQDPPDSATTNETGSPDPGLIRHAARTASWFLSTNTMFPAWRSIGSDL